MYQANFYWLTEQHGGRRSPIPAEFNAVGMLSDGKLRSCRIYLWEDMRPGTQDWGILRPLIPESWTGVATGTQIVILENLKVIGIGYITGYENHKQH